jgi:gliding motility-associated-like protein
VDSFMGKVTVLPVPVPVFTDTGITVSYNTPVVLPACAPAAHIQWFYKDSFICDGCDSLPLQPKDYLSVCKCIVSNGDCSDTCIYNINVTNIPTSDVWVPSAFSPNGDGRNDYLHVVTSNPNFELMELMIFNRWGEKIYDVEGDEGKGWDGGYGGKPVDVGTYYWYLRYKVLGTEGIFSKKGDVTVVR